MKTTSGMISAIKSNRDINKTIFTLYVVCLFCWPAYLTVSIPMIHISPLFIILACIMARSIKRSAVYEYASVRPTSMTYLGLFLFSVFWITRIASDISGYSPSSSTYLTIRDLGWYGTAFIVPIVLRANSIRSSYILKSLILCALFISIIGLMEYVSGRYLADLIINNFHIDVSQDFQAMLLGDKSRNGAFRAQSVFVHPLVFGETLSSLVPIAVAGIFCLKRFWRLISVCSLLSCLGAIPLTGTRTAYVAVAFSLVVSGILYLMTSNSKMRRIVGVVAIPVLSGCAYVFLLPLVILLQAGHTKAEVVSTMFRIQMWDRGTPEIYNRIFMGHGDGASLLIAGVRLARGLTVDDFYLTQLLDFGIVGISSLFLFVCYAFVSLYQAGLSKEKRWLLIAAFAGVCAILVGQKATSIFGGMGIVFLYVGIIASNFRVIPFIGSASAVAAMPWKLDPES